MCLEVSKSSKPRVTNRDITCYKLCILDTKYNIIYSPYQNKRYIIGRTYKARVIDTKPTFLKDYVWRRIYSITHGFHTFSTLHGCIEYKNHMSYNYPCPSDTDVYIMIKCIIPKGSLIYRGKYEYSGGKFLKCYASNKLKIEEKI